jgi:hypothetical protein
MIHPGVPRGRVAHHRYPYARLQCGDAQLGFVRVDTDQPGLFGWGEATLEWKTRGVVGAIHDLNRC